jgi:hypothetical protein
MSLLAASALVLSTGIVSSMFWLIARLPDAAGPH